MKMSIQWHEDSLKNSTRYYAEQRAAAIRAMEEVERGEQKCAFLAEQIAEAKRRGLTSFDQDRLLVKVKK